MSNLIKVVFPQPNSGLVFCPVWFRKKFPWKNLTPLYRGLLNTNKSETIMNNHRKYNKHHHRYQTSALLKNSERSHVQAANLPRKNYDFFGGESFTFALHTSAFPKYQPYQPETPTSSNFNGPNIWCDVSLQHHCCPPMQSVYQVQYESSRL